MSQTVTIELPDDAAQKLGVPANALQAPVQKLVTDTLNTLAALVRSLQDEDFIDRIGAAQTLGNLGIEAAIPALAQVAKNNDPIVSATAIDALRKIGTKKALLAVDRVQAEVGQVIESVPSLASLAGTLVISPNGEPTDLGENHDYYIAQALEQELRGD